MFGLLQTPDRECFSSERLVLEGINSEVEEWDELSNRA